MISYIILAIFFCLWYFFTKKPSVPKGLKSLPSPPGARFFYGHYGLLGAKPSVTLTKWAHDLNSEIYSIKMGRKNYIILNSDKIVEELLQKRGAIYSSRQNSYNFQHILRGVAISGCPYNDYYKKVKAIVGRYFTSQITETYNPLIDRITNKGLSEIIYATSNSLLSDPEPINPRLYVRRITLNIILNITVGTYTTSINDPLFQRLSNWMDCFIRLFSNVDRKLDYFPILKYFPGNKMKKNTKALRDETESLFGEFLENIKSGRNRNSCAMREIYERGELEDYEIIHNMAILTFAGTDTVTSSILWLLAHLANTPLLQEQAHKELNTFLPDHDKLPTSADFKDLPYVRALIREGQRVYPPSWMGIPHYIEQDDEYNGYYIPANSLLLINMHAISFDETRHKNARKFDPNRFLNVKNSMSSLARGAAKKRDHFSFGCGRRLCLGIDLAEYELFIIISRILYCFHIQNTSSTPIDLSTYFFGCTIWPIDYNIKLIPKGDWVEQLLK